MKKWIFTIISLTMILGACSDYVATGEPLPYDPNERETPDLAGGATQNADESGDEIEVAEIPEDLQDGVYETTGEGFGGDITVQTTVEGGKIVSIEVLSHGETDGISDEAINNLPNTIVEQYSLAVDNVSGATWSSKGIKEAVQNAILEASGEGSAAGGSEDEADDAVVEIPEDLQDGVYETTGEGFGGDITVQTTVEGGKIVSIEVLSHGETDGISDDAINNLPNTIVEEYSLGVDNVSGATWSSKGIKEAVQKAIEEASGN